MSEGARGCCSRGSSAALGKKIAISTPSDPATSREAIERSVREPVLRALAEDREAHARELGCVKFPQPAFDIRSVGVDAAEHRGHAAGIAPASKA